jgi:hypothetical protein
MTTIAKTFTSRTGKKIELSINIESVKVSGSALIDGKAATVTGYAVVQNRKCLSIKDGPAPYLPIDDSLYAEIDNTAKAQYRQSMSAEQVAWNNVCAAEATYKRIANYNDSNAEVISAQAAYDKALDEFTRQYPNSDYNKSNRVHYNDGMTNNPWTN